jgi:hypothetical protein
VLKELIRGRIYNKAGSIASGGEMPILILLPVCKEVVAIDHSYRSLAACYLKVLLLDALGPEKLYEVLRVNNSPLFIETCKQFNDMIPAGIMKHAGAVAGYPGNYTVATLAGSIYGEMRREWLLLPKTVLAAAYRRLERLTFVHGDLVNDLPKYGKFNLLYMSNAHEHANRDAKYPKIDDFDKIVKPNGSVLHVTTNYTTIVPKKYPGWTVAKTLTGIRTAWNYHLFKKDPAATQVTV